MKNQDTLQKALEINQKQKEFYSSDDKKKKNYISRLWSQIRNNLLSGLRDEFGIKEKVYNVHKEWFGELANKKVLDLGCLRGNALSIYIAQHAKKYIGIDLSDPAIEELRKKLEKNNCSNAEAIALDFLSPEFEEDDFDIIYAYGVLHHFEDFDLLISKLKEKLKPGGVIISYDPLDTSPPIVIARRLYRPFQSDKMWEWPFTSQTLKKIEDNFTVEKKHGILGYSKYGLLYSILPISKTSKKAKMKKLIEKDWNGESWRDIHRCMHVTMLFRNNIM